MGLGDHFQCESVLDPWAAEAVGWQILVLVRCACLHSRVMVRKAFRMYKNPTPAPFPWLSCSHHYINPLTCPKGCRSLTFPATGRAALPKSFPGLGTCQGCHIPGWAGPALPWLTRNLQHGDTVIYTQGSFVDK